MKRRALTLTAALGFFVAVTTLAVVKFAPGGLDTIKLDTVEQMLTLCMQEPDRSLCGKEAVIFGLDNGVAPLEMIGFLTKQYDSQKQMPLGCHDAMHHVGHYVNPLETSLEPYYPYLKTCWMGLVDGIVESQKINPDVKLAAAQLTEFCKVLDSKLPEQHGLGKPFRYCWHPFGHGLWESYKSLEKSITVCNLAAPVGIDRFWCTQAVMMQVKDLISDKRQLPTGSTAAFAAIDRECTTISLGDPSSFEGCQAGYLRAVQLKNPELFLPFLSKCMGFSAILKEQCQQTAAESTGSLVAHSDVSMREAMDRNCAVKELYVGCFHIVTELLIHSERYTPERAADIVAPAVREMLPEYFDEYRELLVDKFGLRPDYAIKSA